MDRNEKDNNVKDSSKSAIDSGFFRFVTMKLNRLSSATYMVTNFMSDNEPIKWKLRTAVLDLTVDLTPGQISSVLYRVSVLEKTINRFDALLALLDIALAAGTASEMNLMILKKEYATLRETILRKSPHQFLENYVVGGLLEAPQMVATSEESHAQQSSIKTETKPIARVKAGEDNLSLRQHSAGLSRQVFGTPKPAGIGSIDASKNRRKQLILGYLEGKQWTSIKDIADIVTDCSRKTVQRELADMVDQGILKKKGDRRWSRYLLAK